MLVVVGGGRGGGPPLTARSRKRRFKRTFVCLQGRRCSHWMRFFAGVIPKLPFEDFYLFLLKKNPQWICQTAVESVVIMWFEGPIRGMYYPRGGMGGGETNSPCQNLHFGFTDAELGNQIWVTSISSECEHLEWSTRTMTTQSPG